MTNAFKIEMTNKNGYGVAALMMGLIPFIIFPAIFFIPLVMLAISFIAIILGAMSVNSPKKKSAIAGLVLGVVAFLYISTLLLGLY